MLGIRRVGVGLGVARPGSRGALRSRAPRLRSRPKPPRTATTRARRSRGSPAEAPEGWGTSRFARAPRVGRVRHQGRPHRQAGPAPPTARISRDEEDNAASAKLCFRSSPTRRRRPGGFEPRRAGAQGAHPPSRRTRDRPGPHTQAREEHRAAAPSSDEIVEKTSNEDDAGTTRRTTTTTAVTHTGWRLTSRRIRNRCRTGSAPNARRRRRGSRLAHGQDPA